MKILFLQLTLLLSVFNIKAQSKKEIISTLNIHIDSLNSEIKNRDVKFEIEVVSNNKYKESTIAQIKKLEYDLQSLKNNFDSINILNNKLYDDNLKLQSQLKTSKDSLSLFRQKNDKDSIYPLDEKDIPNKIKASAEACTDCHWYNYSGMEMGELLFVHDAEEDKLYFNLEGDIFNIPLKSRKFKNGTTETGRPNGTGTLIFEGDGIKIVLDFAQAGFGYGSAGLLTIFKSGKEIKNINIRCDL
jgi:hypothetical protein